MKKFIIYMIILSLITGCAPHGGDPIDIDKDGQAIIRTQQPDITDTASPIESEEPTMNINFHPHSVEGTRPSDFGIETGLQFEGERVSEYTRSEKIFFDVGKNYTDMKGVITFRGNNFRDTPAYGKANITEKKFDTSTWSFSTGSLTKMYGNGAWTGSGWTGQPLLVEWDSETKKIMNMKPWAKEKDGLVEAIYATLDGNIYFLDAETGEQTRESISLGFPFKGAGALDPRGIPLMYVGAGDDSPLDGGKKARAFIISLVDGKKLYEFGTTDEFSLRDWYAYDSSALVDAKTDTLIYPGENGILYMMKLNTQYDKEAGTLSINPSEKLKWRYKGKKSGVDNKYWLGIEDSAIIYGEYAIFSDNGGLLMCLNINTYEVIWVQDVLDDTNDTPILELEDGHPYVYISTSFHGGWRAEMNGFANIPIWKIDAETGEIVWKNTDFNCQTSDGVSGGVQGTIAVGKNKLSNLIFVPVSFNPDGYKGKLVALDKKTGKQVWSFDMAKYPWSSPVCVYDDDGNGYIIQCNQAGNMYLLDGLTGKQLDVIDLGSNVEASPAVFNNMVVVGTRGQKIYGIKIK